MSQGGTARAKASHLCHKVRLPQITSREALGFIVFILIMTFPVAKLDSTSGNYIVQCMKVVHSVIFSAIWSPPCFLSLSLIAHSVTKSEILFVFYYTWPEIEIP